MNAPILCVVGARPNFMKMAAILPALKARQVATRLIHTGQHYDPAMKETFFQQLGIPEPDMDLEVGSGTHAVQTARIMMGFEPVIDAEKPRAVLVVGDVNSTIACALVAVKKGVPVIHVEAGLRSGDRGMPEEINRILTDQLSDFLFTTERSAEDNLVAEGIDRRRIHFVGNVMIDTLFRLLPLAPTAVEVMAAGGHGVLDGAAFGLVTLHRPSNVDDPETLNLLMTCLAQQSKKLPLVFPVHPRTRQRLQDGGLDRVLDRARVILLPPVGYLEMLGLMKSAKVILTDSGGVQEESTALGCPCLTLRENTERPVTVTEGTNTVVGRDPEKIAAVLDDILTKGGKAGRIPELWDGHAADRIAQHLAAV
ncbi:MAG: UDP-N-acetylglucosamine 2-epimerase (non-hydrolyzing) [Magnetococcales bacterium]|nr:UDP-N-acetylglucosamine 2-epimerase (non-hydrolyzing) [Magnetococcales bacterium]MBF0151978.1 UDP-N-acetylglucosamine 2-epimerase (non-hydrolyzing) [Magnetococcales bacterium]MBF0172596.1 UDP-N-acetylglucosamine 2-epimerase (non-hydrolyzing) [Magnetococcales bacterium]MBF0348961.1 UDP-N-acetylglucosamine 2-epimerase (non-hydrolyzing) [Magnetococcales bacterium]MBF0630239.1 UDP-N-acetylglucosamine 2-epimerase (non-hydrolyzing) [Magnetococcales bacterium]